MEEHGISEYIELKVIEIAYVVKDPYFPMPFEIHKSANAWWMDSTKLDKIVTAFKAGLTIKAACVYAGITRRQYDYFVDMHPEFCLIKEGLEEVQMIGFMDLINTEGKKDLPTARWYLDRRHPKFAAKVRVDTEEKVLQPSTQVNIAIGNNIDAGTIAEAVRGVVTEVLAQRSLQGGTEDITSPSVAGDSQS